MHVVRAALARLLNAIFGNVLSASCDLQPRGAPSVVLGDYTAAFTLTSFALALLMVRCPDSLSMSRSNQV